MHIRTMSIAAHALDSQVKEEIVSAGKEACVRLLHVDVANLLGYRWGMNDYPGPPHRKYLSGDDKC